MSTITLPQPGVDRFALFSAPQSIRRREMRHSSRVYILVNTTTGIMKAISLSTTNSLLTRPW